MAAPNLLTVRLSLDQAGSLWNADKNLTTNGGHSQSGRAMSVRSGWVACLTALGSQLQHANLKFYLLQASKAFHANRHFRIEPGHFQSSMLMLEKCKSIVETSNDNYTTMVSKAAASVARKRISLETKLNQCDTCSKTPLFGFFCAQSTVSNGPFSHEFKCIGTK